MDFMSWGNGFGTEGQRAREFSLRQGCLECGHCDGSAWSSVRAPSRVDDGAWHRVAVTKDGTEARLCVDGAEVAAGLIDNCVEQTTWA